MQGKPAVLFVVAETPVGYAVKAGGDGRRRPVRVDAGVDVAESAFAFNVQAAVAGQCQVIGESEVRLAGSHGSKAAAVDVGQVSGADGSGCFRPVRRREEEGACRWFL